METRRGRDAVDGSMRSTTARPVMLLGRGRPSVEAQDEDLLTKQALEQRAIVWTIRHNHFSRVGGRQAQGRKYHELPRGPISTETATLCWKNLYQNIHLAESREGRLRAC